MKVAVSGGLSAACQTGETICLTERMACIFLEVINNEKKTAFSINDGRCTVRGHGTGGLHLRQKNDSGCSFRRRGRRESLTASDDSRRDTGRGDTCGYNR